MRENAYAKARRYLGEGRLTVGFVDSHRIRASCRGGGTIYQLGYDRGGWYCDCPARGPCAHVIGLQLVTVRGEEAVEGSATSG